MSMLTQACVATDASENEAEYTYQTCIHGSEFLTWPLTEQLRPVSAGRPHELLLATRMEIAVRRDVVYLTVEGRPGVNAVTAVVALELRRSDPQGEGLNRALANELRE